MTGRSETKQEINATLNVHNVKTQQNFMQAYLKSRKKNVCDERMQNRIITTMKCKLHKAKINRF